MTDPKTISHSQFSTWSNCPWDWKLKYIDGWRQNESTIHTIFGTAMHEVIQDWLDILYNKSEKHAKHVYLHDTFKDKLAGLFKENIKVDEEGQKTFLADKATLTQFYEQGCQILNYIQKNYTKIFPTENVKLFGIEFALDIQVRQNVRYIGYIDIVTHNTETDQYVLYDLKTSKNGWTKEKTDPVKIGQLLLYKKFFAEQMGVPEKNISVEYVILKRIIFENADYPVPRVSRFVPPNGTPSMNKNWAAFQRFLNACFTDEGEYIAEQAPTPSRNACRFCQFKERRDFCHMGVSE